MAANRKYFNKITYVNGIRFDSKKEAERWFYLQQLEKAGDISQLERQKTYQLWVGRVLVCKYRADFDYIDKNGLPVTEDVKGVITPEFKIKAKLFQAIFHRAIVIT